MKRAAWSLVGCLMVMTLVLASCSSAAPAEETEREGAGTPEYGGTIVLTSAADYESPDPWYGFASPSVGLVLEKLGMADWAIDREVFDFSSWYVPLAIVNGHLAERYDQPDPLTIVFYIRQGVYWHDKPPMNGRELDAYDVEYSFHRILGLGSGFTAPSPYASALMTGPIVSVTATDKRTVVFKMSSPEFSTLRVIYFESTDGNWIQPREVIEQYGDLQDWKNLVGTGPYELTDWVGGSSLTYTKNPNYWDYDEKYPENRLPYADEIRILVMPEIATRMSALRSGQTATMGGIAPDQADSLRRTHPALVFSSQSVVNDAIAFNMTIPDAPWQDIRVRKAMRMVLDLERIKDTYYAGFADTTPYGILGPGTVGYHVPYDEWPEETKEGYSYDPEKAKQLMEDAGYAEGFRTTYELVPDYSGGDVDLAQILQGYWAEINVTVDIKTIEAGAYVGNYSSKGYGGLFSTPSRGTDYDPLYYVRTMGYSGEMWNGPGASDPVFDALVDNAEAATDLEEMMRYVTEADMRWIEQHYDICLLRVPGFTFWQPWLKGYNGEISLGAGMESTIFSRVWIDRELKTDMGH